MSVSHCPLQSKSRFKKKPFGQIYKLTKIHYQIAKSFVTHLPIINFVHLTPRYYATFPLAGSSKTLNSQ